MLIAENIHNILHRKQKINSEFQFHWRTGDVQGVSDVANNALGKVVAFH